jgi:hypothetical protein
MYKGLYQLLGKEKRLTVFLSAFAISSSEDGS